MRVVAYLTCGAIGALAACGTLVALNFGMQAAFGFTIWEAMGL